jgi:S1-C subfamily serine protease
LGDNNIYSINGAIQYKADRTKNFASGIGVAVSGKNTISLDNLVFKQIDYREKNSSGPSPGDENVKSTGSGIVVGTNGYVLTSYHVVENSSKLFVEITENNSSKTYKASIVQKDEANDLAILKIEDADFKPYSELEYSFIDNNIIDVGASVFTIGFPYALSGMGKGAKFTDGKISSKTGYDGAINSYQTSVPVQPGNSGGPLFNNKGQLIGVIFSKINNADNVSYAVKLNYAKNLIELLPDNHKYPSKNIENLPLEEKVKVLTKYVVLVKSK